jgi:alkylhydroperoxidase family enzyme
VGPQDVGPGSDSKNNRGPSAARVLDKCARRVAAGAESGDPRTAHALDAADRGAEVALLRMANAMADTSSNVSDELYQELRRHFSEAQLIELAATAALACSMWEATDCIAGV